MLHVDGASNVNESGVGLALNSLGGGGPLNMQSI